MSLSLCIYIYTYTYIYICARTSSLRSPHFARDLLADVVAFVLGRCLA